MNLLGKVVGRLTVIKRAEKIGSRIAWTCRCSCGKEVIVLQQSLRSSDPTQSCGCLRGEALTKDLKGQKFGLWEVLSLSSRKKKPAGGVYWLCRCDCGLEKEVAAESLLSEKSTNCGCARLRPICIKGHSIQEWGRASGDGSCRACLKNRNFLRNYGITLDEYIGIWKFQEGKCAICKKPISIQLGRPGFVSGCRAELDHEHNPEVPKKQQVRGVLCGGRWAGCNRKLGRLDKVEWLSSALEYLKNPPARQYFNKGLGYLGDDPERIGRALRYPSTPPATAALGAPRYGLPGRVGTKKQRRLFKKLQLTSSTEGGIVKK